MRESSRERAVQEIAQVIMAEDVLDPLALGELVRRICSKHKVRQLPSHSEIYSCIPLEQRGRFRPALRTKPVRTASGVVVIGVMSKPLPCPHGRCAYCPGGVSRGTPQSYTGWEPSALRAVQNNYDPFLQLTSRLKQLEATGHRVGKVELVIQGGTFLSADQSYQECFVKSCFDALNDRVSLNIHDAMCLAEHAERRNVGLTVETRPDFCKQRHVNMILSLGGTRVEIGVQALSDEVYRSVDRGHTVQDVYESFQIAKDSGLKIVAHMMPGLPGSSPEIDREFFHQLLFDERLKPDMLKIYPTLVIPGTRLHELFLQGKYHSYDLDATVSLIADVKRFIPRWVRIMRVQREIPAWEIESGVKKGNLRELVLNEVARRGYRCRCIRCREVGLAEIKRRPTFDRASVQLVREDYTSSEGAEVFLSFEAPQHDLLIGFLRLRTPSLEAHRKEVASTSCTIVRELHVYGEALPLGVQSDGAWQHKGYGLALMAEAERISREEFDARRILVTSAVGTREYYYRIGYSRDGPYVAKVLS